MRKPIIKILMFAVATFCMELILSTSVLTNELAMLQLETSNEAYLLWEVFQHGKKAIYTIYGAGTIVLVFSVIWDVYKYGKSKIKCTEKENAK